MLSYLNILGSLLQLLLSFSIKIKMDKTIERSEEFSKEELLSLSKYFKSKEMFFLASTYTKKNIDNLNFVF